MTTRAHPGHVRRPGLTSGLGGTVVARPMATNELLSLPDGFAVGPAKVGTDDNGDLQGDGLVVDYVDGLLWDTYIEFDDPELGTKSLGVLDLNTDGEPLHEIVATDIHVITATDWVDVQAAIALGALDDTIIAAKLNDTTSATYGAAIDKLEPKYALTFKATDPNYVGVSDTATITNVIAAAAASTALGRIRVDLDGKTYSTTAKHTIPTGTTISNGKLVYTGASTTTAFLTVAASADRWGLRDVDLDVGLANAQTSGGVLVPGTATIPTALFVSGTSTNGRVRGGSIRGGKSWAIWVDSGAANVTVEDVFFSDLKGGVYIYEAAVNVRVLRCEFTRWHGVAIYVEGSATAAPSRLDLSENLFHDPSYYSSLGNGFVARQMIAVQPVSGKPVKGLTCNKNQGYGPAEAFSDSITGGRGTGDQFSFWYVEDFEICHNLSLYGGENGYSLVKGCKNGVFGFNLAAFNDGHGVQIGSAGFTVSNVNAVGLITYNNGQDRASETAETIAGVFAQDTNNLSLVDCYSFDDQGGGATQDYGFSLANCPNTFYGPNAAFGNTTGSILDSGTTTYKRYVDTNAATLGDGTASVIQRINGATGQRREIRWQTAGVDRWRFYAGSGTETGSNAGSNLFLDAMADNGTTVTNAITVNRATGIVAFPKGITTNLFAPYVFTAGASITGAGEQTILTVPTIPATALSVGSVIQLRVHGNFDNIATSGTFLGRVRVNGVSLWNATIAPSQTGAQTLTGYDYDFEIMVTATGAGGAVTLDGTTTVVSTATATQTARTAQTAATPVDLSSGLTITVQGTTSTNNAGNILRVKSATVTQPA